MVLDLWFYCLLLVFKKFLMWVRFFLFFFGIMIIWWRICEVIFIKGKFIGFVSVFLMILF